MSMRMIALVLLLVGCTGPFREGATKLHLTPTDCTRQWLISVARVGSYYCQDALGSGALSCIDTSWYYDDSREPDVASHTYNSVIYGGSAVEVSKFAGFDEKCK